MYVVHVVMYVVHVFVVCIVIVLFCVVHLLCCVQGVSNGANCIRDYVIFTILLKITLGLHQVCTRITHNYL